MTTIAFRDGVLAGDGRLTLDQTIVSDSARKVHRLSDGRLFGWAGSVEDAECLRISIRRNLELPSLNNLTALMVHSHGAIEIYEGSMWRPVNEPYHAIGAGADYALAAMDAGATAVEAVRIGIKRNTASGGKVKSVRLKGLK